MDVRQPLERAHQLLSNHQFEPVFLGIRGSVVYELPGTHADTDVRAVYLAPTAEILSIRGSRQTLEMTEGTLDFVGWEAGRFFHHLLSHNGNMVELLLTPEDMVWCGTKGRALREIGHRFVTRKLHRYYRGYAQSQFKRAQQQIRTGKGAIYTYREMYAGIWLLRTGELVFPWAELRAKVEGEDIYHSVLLDEFNMDRDLITDHVLLAMRSEFADLTKILDESVVLSPLPEGYDGYEACNNLLLKWRSAGWV